MTRIRITACKKKKSYMKNLMNFNGFDHSIFPESKIRIYFEIYISVKSKNYFHLCFMATKYVNDCKLQNILMNEKKKKSS